MNVVKIPAKLPRDMKKIKVAAYARVSTKSDAQLHSLDAQINYYRHKICQREDWSFAGVFIDDGLTGTRRERPGLEELLIECREGRIDLVLTKAISRFARNTVDLLSIVRELKELDIAVFFERENINSLTADGELMLTLLASFAQEESRSMSLNKHWSIQKQFANGEIAGMAQFYGYDVINGELVVNDHEARIIRMIYADYLGGMQSSEIAAKLNQMSEPKKRGGKWKTHDITDIFRNEKRTGNALLNKHYVIDPITKKRKYNHGERQQYYVENSHEGIISQELFDAAQEEMKRRASNKNPVKPHGKPFTGIMSCKCGAKFQRKKTRVRVFWRCGRNLGYYGGSCSMKGIPENTLEDLCCEVLSINEFETLAVTNNIKAIYVTAPNAITFHLLDGSIIDKTWKDRSRSESWTVEMRAEAGRKTRERAKHAK